MSISAALADAARNCSQQNAVATVTLESGIQYTGKLERDRIDMGTHHIKLEHGGWVTLVSKEIAAVESRRYGNLLEQVVIDASKGSS